MKFKKKTEKREYEGHPYLFLLYIFSLIIAGNILIDSVETNNHWARFAFFYLGISFSFYFYKKERDKESHKRQISRLNQEIKTLENSLESRAHDIEYLKKELEQAQSSESQR